MSSFKLKHKSTSFIQTPNHKESLTTNSVEALKNHVLHEHPSNTTLDWWIEVDFSLRKLKRAGRWSQIWAAKSHHSPPPP